MKIPESIPNFKGNYKYRFTIYAEKATLNKVETIKCLKIYGNILVINIIGTFSVKDTPVR